MTGVTTGQTALPTATDSDDVESYSTGPSGLVRALQMLADLFDSVTGHDHAGSGKGKPIANAGIANSAVDTAQLATHAATQSGSATFSGQSTASTSLVDITGAAVTLSTTGGDVLLFASLSISNSGVNDTVFSVVKDGVGIDTAARQTTPVSNQNSAVSFIFRDAAPVAGSHTYKLQWVVSAGTTTQTSGVNGSIIAVELKR